MSDSERQRIAERDPDFAARLGHCYENAGRRAMGDERATLVHGTIQGFGYPPNPHAWIQYPGGIVWDPTLNRELPARFYEARFNARPEAEYTADEAAVQMLVNGNWGPWHEDD